MTKCNVPKAEHRKPALLVEERSCYALLYEGGGRTEKNSVSQLIRMLIGVI